MQFNGIEQDEGVDFFMKIGEEQLIDITRGPFSYFLHDEHVRKIRKILTIEQYFDPQIASIYATLHLDDLLKFQLTMFASFVQAGRMVPEGPQVITIHIYTPIVLCINICDIRPERESDVPYLERARPAEGLSG